MSVIALRGSGRRGMCSTSTTSAALTLRPSACEWLATGTPPNLALSMLGVNGLTAYFGMIEIGKITAQGHG
jgi:NADPH-dependent curcumin reductase CurA